VVSDFILSLRHKSEIIFSLLPKKTRRFEPCF
jgi:hypothetical protein